MKIPEEMVKLLRREKFCVLATSHQDHPHASLMNFTYLEEEKMIIMSSREDTAKVQNIKENPEVALLLYDLGEGGEAPVSCTIHGSATLAGPESYAHYRERHYQKHQQMGAFIQGENISMIAVSIKHAALSDVEDKVRTWNQRDGSFDSLGNCETHG